MKRWKNFLALTFFLVSVFLFGGVANGLSAVDLSIVKLEANDVELAAGTPKSIQVTDEIDILLVFDSNINTSDMQIEAVLRGYDYGDLIEDISEVFEVKSGNRYDTRLQLRIPRRLEQGRYDIKLRFDDRTDATYTVTYPLDVGSARHALQIKDVVLDPENEIKAKRTIISKVRVKNYGERDEESVKVKISIPELGISASEYIDEIESGDSVTSPELFMRVPEGTETGQYTLRVKVEYHDGEKAEEEEFSYRVLGADEEETGGNEETPESRTVITISQETQEVTAGVGGIVYPITIANEGSESRTYSVEVEGADNWATTRITPSNTEIIEGGETESLYVYVSAGQSASAGEHMFSVTVRSGETVLKQIPLKANVISAQATPKLVSRATLVKLLQIGLVTFIVLLVILGLIIGFNKLRGEEIEEPEEGSEKYY
ncbi:hypothetical protein CMO89_02705 [Candidatus Woesearchaeota archaeon]|nr:hypothetical protein [Candidatus Woesearchaeota archaeon]|tara:strand:+ start:12807 stop:14102 length:1296 start_codon:yes stop_codon:yes gene_type:complete